jgi:hypothetical protein
MKAYKKWRRTVRAVALAVPVSATLAMSATAAAMPARDGAIPRNTDNQYQAAPAPKSEKPFTLPSTFRTEVQTPAPAVSTTATPPPVVREIRTVMNYGDRTFAIVLASVALGVALGGTAYLAMRLTAVRRSTLGSSS